MKLTKEKLKQMILKEYTYSTSRTRHGDYGGPDEEAERAASDKRAEWERSSARADKEREYQRKHGMSDMMARQDDERRARHQAKTAEEKEEAYQEIGFEMLDGMVNYYLGRPAGTFVSAYNVREAAKIKAEEEGAQKAAAQPEERSFMQKAGSFLTGGGFKESLGLSTDELRKMIQEEIATVISARKKNG